MTAAEYQLRMEAYQLQEAKNINDLALQAWFNQQVKATTGSSKHPKPKFKHFDDFYSYQGAIDKIRLAYEPDYKPKSAKVQHQEQAEIMAKRMKEFEELKKAGKIPGLEGGG